MYKYVETCAWKLERYINKQSYSGLDFFDTKEQAAEFAKRLRAAGLRCRRVTLPETSSWTPGNDYPERYIVFLHDDDDWNAAMDLLIRYEEEGYPV
jgi:hypothetical protein